MNLFEIRNKPSAEVMSTCLITEKKRQSEELNGHIEQFLASGGKIDKVSTGATHFQDGMIINEFTGLPDNATRIRGREKGADVKRKTAPKAEEMNETNHKDIFKNVDNYFYLRLRGRMLKKKFKTICEAVNARDYKLANQRKMQEFIV